MRASRSSALMIPGGALTVGGLSVLLSYANQYMKPFNDISSVVTEMQNALACAGRIFALLEEQPESPDADGAVEDVRGEVDIRNVDFATTRAAGSSSSSTCTWSRACASRSSGRPAAARRRSSIF